MNKIKIIIYAVNLILVGLIIARIFQIDNDKGHLLFLFYCPFIALVNFLLGLILKLIRYASYKAFWSAAGFLLIIFIPVYMIVIWI